MILVLLAILSLLLVLARLVIALNYLAIVLCICACACFLVRAKVIFCLSLVRLIVVCDLFLVSAKIARRRRRRHRGELARLKDGHANYAFSAPATRIKRLPGQNRPVKGERRREIYKKSLARRAPRLSGQSRRVLSVGANK